MAQKFRKQDYPIVSVQGAEFLDMLFAVHPFIFFFNFKVRLKMSIHYQQTDLFVKLDVC